MNSDVCDFIEKYSAHNFSNVIRTFEKRQKSTSYSCLAHQTSIELRSLKANA